MKTRQWASRALPLVLMAMIGVVVWLNAEHQGNPVNSVVCVDLAAGCLAQVGGRSLSLGTDGPVKPLKPFQVWVKAPGARRVEIHFTMEGMDMGFNLYTLRADSPDVFRTSVTLPVCVSGRRDWRMTLDIDGVRLAVPFVTEL